MRRLARIELCYHPSVHRPLLNFDALSPHYERTRFVPDQVLRELAELLVQRLGRGARSSVLELGVGGGRAALPLAQAGLRVVGIDLSRNMMEVLHKNRGGEGPVLVQGNIQSLPFHNESFGCVLAYHVLHLVPGLLAVLQEIRRVLNQSGALFWVADGYWDHCLPLELRQKYKDLVDGEHNTDLPSARDFALVHGYLGNRARVRVLAVERGSWDYTVDLSALLEMYQAKQFPFLLQVPDIVHRRTMKELRQWCDARYPAGYQEMLAMFLEVREIVFS